MPTISTCPHCMQTIAIPEGVEDSVLVRCPLCNNEYPLNEVLELIPPELIVVESADEVEPVDSTRPDDADASDDAFEGMSDDASGVVSEDASEEIPTIIAPPLVSSVILRYGTSLKSDQNPNSIFTVEETAETVDTADTTENPLDEDVFSLIAKHKEEVKNEYPNQSEPLALRHRSQRKPKHVFRIFVEIVLGGVMGISIGYFALAWLVWLIGARFDFPHPPQILKPVIQYVLPDKVWEDRQE
jgi:hypothetical protein